MLAITTYQKRVHAKYDKFFRYVVEALGLKENEYKIHHTYGDHREGSVGEIVLHTNDIFAKVGSIYIPRIDEVAGNLFYHWCFNKRNQLGGVNKFLPLCILDNPTIVLTAFKTAMEEKQQEMEQAGVLR